MSHRGGKKSVLLCQAANLEIKISQVHRRLSRQLHNTTAAAVRLPLCQCVGEDGQHPGCREPRDYPVSVTDSAPGVSSPGSLLPPPPPLLPKNDSPTAAPRPRGEAFQPAGIE